MNWNDITNGEDGLSVRNKLNDALGFLINLPYRTINGSVSVLTTDRFLYVDSTGGARQITLPEQSGLHDGNIVTIIKVNSGGGDVTVVPSGSDTIMGQANMTLRFQYDQVTFQVRTGETDWIAIL